MFEAHGNLLNFNISLIFQSIEDTFNGVIIHRNYQQLIAKHTSLKQVLLLSLKSPLEQFKCWVQFGAYKPKCARGERTYVKQPAFTKL